MRLPALLLVLWCDAPVVSAQAERVAAPTAAKIGKRAAAPTSRAMRLLDVWIVGKFRGAQLLVDSARAARPNASDVPLPRVEVVRRASTGDTLIAMQFAPTDVSPPLRATGVVRLADASGAMTALSARVLTRRMFRAPRLPHASSGADSAWRVGWAYVAVVQPLRRAVSVRPERAWLLVDATDSTSRRPAR